MKDIKIKLGKGYSCKQKIRGKYSVTWEVYQLNHNIQIRTKIIIFSTQCVSKVMEFEWKF